MIKAAVMGYGTVGSGVVEVLCGNKELIAKRTGEAIEVKYILDLRQFPGDPYEDKIVHDVNVIMEDPEVSVVCEVMGGVGAAYAFTKMALEKGKSVCTSNKELVAMHGPELLALAKQNHCNYFFEASVGGGIPVIRTINQALTAEKIEGISGILNGTTNYILSKMERESADFEAVLKEAQEKGYAERNPEADVEGYDACRKIAILTSLMLGKTVDYQKIPTEGIGKITAADFLYAGVMDCSIKLLGISKLSAEGPVAMVAPFLVDKENPLSTVNGVFNAVCVTGNMLGDAMLYGRGAGKLPTASAVVADVVECVRNQGRTLPCLWDNEEAVLADHGQCEREMFLRLRPEALEKVKELFPGGRELYIEGRSEDVGYLVPKMREKLVLEGCVQLGEQLLNRLRMAV